MKSGVHRLRRVLVVDDDADLRGHIRDFLELEGFLVTEAQDGADGLRQLTPRHGVVLLDLLMPKMDGIAFRRTQLLTPPVCDIPVLVMSGDTTMPERVAGLGVMGFVTKPVEPEPLVAMLQVVFS